MRGKKLTAAESQLRRVRYWRRRRARARTVAGQAAVAWDQVRAEIGELPVGERDAAWLLVIDALDRVGCQLDTHVDTASATPTRTGARAGARGAERNTTRKERGR